MTPTPDRVTWKSPSVRRSTSGRLPGLHTPHEIDHVHAAGLLEEARGRRRALACPAIDDDRARRDLRQTFTKMFERDVHAPGDRLPPPLAFVPHVDQGEGAAREASAEDRARDTCRMADEGDQPPQRLDAAVEITHDAMEPGALEQSGDLVLGSGRADEDDRTVRREQRLRPARKPTGEPDVRAAVQMPGGEIFTRSRVKD